MRLFIAEKPSLGRAIAENLGKGMKKDGYISLNEGKDVVTWCFGHILEQYNPDEYDEKYRRWNLDDLPIVPGQWKLKIKKDAAKQFKVIKGLVKDADYVVNAGDPDREGQLLVDEVLEYIGNTKPTKRILLNALDSKSVKAALQDLRDNEEFSSFRDSARARSQADWLVGMNLTRAYTIKSQKAGYEGVVHVGRVQTPTLALVVRREEEIQHFKPTTHYICQVLWKHENGDIPTTLKFKQDMEGLDAEGRLLSKEVAEGLLSKIEAVAAHGDGAAIEKVEQKEKQEGQRFPYSLSSLQVDAGRKYGYSPQQVLDTMQSLYEKKFTTYPRSDCEYLPTNQLADAPEIIAHLCDVKELEPLCENMIITTRSRAWNDRKISAHHAIIPTTVKVAYDSLSEIEQRLYLLVAKAYLAQFYPIHRYLATKITISCADQTFVANGKQIIELGWKALYKEEKKDDEEEAPALPSVNEGDAVSYAKGVVKEKTTTPPKRFTESTLLQAMKEIYKYVKDKELVKKLKECKGIGTEATRAGIIETLKKADFFKVEKKKIIPTEKGQMAIKVLPDAVTYPDSTAIWEAELDQIVDKKIGLSDFLKHQTEILDHLLKDAKEAQIAANKDAILCPKCHKPMKRRKGKNGYFWGCTGYPDCTMTFPDKKGKPDMEAKKSSATGKTAKCPVCGKNLRQIKGKFGTFWGCEDRECKTTFPDHKDEPVIIKCPKCGEGYLKRSESKKSPGKFYWWCSARCGAPSVWDKDGLSDLK